MKKFIKNIILFSVPIIVSLTIMELALRSIPNDYLYKAQYLNNFSNNIKVLYLGNSHMYFGINPEFASVPSFNAAYVSQSLKYDLAILEKYDGKWKSLTHLVIPIGYLSFYTTLESIEKWRIKNYNLYYDLNVGGVWDHFEIANGKFGYNLSRVWKRIEKGESDLTTSALGFGNTYNSKKGKDLRETGISAAKRHTSDINQTRYFSENLKALRFIIKFAKELKIKIIFLTPPAFKSYVENLDPKQLNNTLKNITDIASPNSHTKFYNLLEDSSFNAQDFYDADHLNEIGAKKLTLKIDSIIKLR